MKKKEDGKIKKNVMPQLDRYENMPTQNITLQTYTTQSSVSGITYGTSKNIKQV